MDVGLSQNDAISLEKKSSTKNLSSSSNKYIIWFLEIDLEVEKNNWISIPITVDIVDDSETIAANKIIKEHSNKINKIINIKEKDNDNDNDNDNETTHGFELILGIGFLKSYRANIDFSSMTITLNKNIKIKFN